MSNQIKNVKALLKNGANPDIPDSKGVTALAKAKNTEIAELLKKYGAQK